MYLKFPPIALAVLSALCLCTPAQATILNEYTNLSGWNAVTTGSVTQDFSTGGNASVGTVAGITMGSVKYLGFYNESVTTAYQTDRFAPYPGYTMGYGAALYGGAGSFPANGAGVFDSGIRVDVSLVSGIRSISFDYSAYRNAAGSGSLIYSTSGTPILLTFQLFESSAPTVVASTRTLQVATGSPGPAFYGFTTTGDISSIKILINTPSGTEGNRVILDNFAYGQIASTGGDPGPPDSSLPEPSTYVLCAAGLLGLSISRRVRK